MKSLPKETRDRLRQNAAGLLQKIPEIQHLYEYVVMNLDQISVELEEL